MRRQQPRVLVTGGAGFIGSHLCERLLAMGYFVTAVDNLLTGQRKNIELLEDDPNFEFWELDLIDALPFEPWDYIFHLASPASPKGYMRYPVETLLVNAIGTHRVLEAARAANARFLLASTSEVYGDPLVHPQPETYWGNVNPTGPRACYDEGKRFAEALTMSYRQRYGLDVRIVRIFNTYGPRHHPEDGRMVPTFILQALTGRPITVFGDGKQTRSLCYVADLVEGMVRAQFRPGTAGEIINLGRPDEHTVLEYAEIIKRLAGSSSPIVFMPGRDEEISRRCPDISKARALLDWEPVVSLEEGLGETVRWFREEVLPTYETT